MDIFTKIYLAILGVFGLPIVVGMILRKIAGKHAPAYYETDEEAFAAREKARKDFEDEQYEFFRDQQLGINRWQE